MMRFPTVALPRRQASEEMLPLMAMRRMADEAKAHRTATEPYGSVTPSQTPHPPGLRATAAGILAAGRVARAEVAPHGWINGPPQHFPGKVSSPATVAKQIVNAGRAVRGEPPLR